MNMLGKEEYARLMIETSKQIEPFILEFLNPLKAEKKELYNLCAELLLKKIGTFETRAYLMRQCFEICAKKAWADSVKYACAAVELELASMYYANRIFDDKGGKEILSKPNEQFISAMITRDLASQALTKACKKLDYKTFVRIKDIFDEVNKIGYIGQFYEIRFNIYERQKANLKEKELMDLYYKRNYGVNSSFFEKIAIIGAILGEGSPKQIEALASFGKNYGIALQIINDIADFVPPELNKGTEEKLPEDSYSDIKHGKLTPPIIYCLIHGGENDKKLVIEALTNNKIEKSKLIEITDTLIRNGSIKFSEEKAREFVEKAKHSIKSFPEKRRNLLEGICFIAYSNRYYKALNELKKQIS